jgi:hypothetical protein
MIPSKIRVKLLSEAAGYITFSPVVQRDFSMPELLEILLAVLGRDAGRIRQILRAGTISTGEYRYRWDSLDIAEQELDSILETFAGPDPSRVFQPESCFLVRFRHGIETLDLPRESAARKPLFARQSFWEGLLGSFGQSVRYADYSHADKADVFALELEAEGRGKLESLVPLLRPRSFAERLVRFQPERIEWLMRR